MNKIKIIFIIVFLALMISCPPVQAMIVDLADVNGLGYFMDDSTGRVWMDVDNFLGMSYYDVVNFLDGTGFRLATYSELIEMHGGTYPIDYPYLADVMGDSFEIVPMIAGIYGDPKNGTVQGSYLVGPDGRDWQYDLFAPAGEGASWVGAWVIDMPNSYAVPEPATILMMGSAFLGCFFFRKKSL